MSEAAYIRGIHYPGPNLYTNGPAILLCLHFLHPLASRRSPWRRFVIVRGRPRSRFPSTNQSPSAPGPHARWEIKRKTREEGRGADPGNQEFNRIPAHADSETVTVATGSASWHRFEQLALKEETVSCSTSLCGLWRHVDLNSQRRFIAMELQMRRASTCCRSADRN